MKERKENSCPATDYSRYLCELICTVYENCDDCPYKETDDEENAPQDYTEEQKELSFSDVKPTPERLAKISENRKVFVKRYNSAKAAGLLRKL